MYQFNSGFSSINNFVVGAGGVKAGQPIKFAAGKLVVASAASTIVGVATTTVAQNGNVGFQAGGTLSTSMIDGTSAIAVGDELEVGANGILVKKSAGSAVAIALTAVTTNMSTTSEATVAAGLVDLPQILLK